MDKKTIIFASGNQGKIREVKEILKEYNVIGMKEAGFTGDIEETGKTFHENALIKAKAVSTALNLPALADDSGLCVEALNGAPGIYSARYAGDGIDAHNNQLLLKNLENKKNRRAKFVCSLVMYYPNGEIISAEGETYGNILEKITGENGFGYDCVFFSDDLNLSLGLASPQEKNKISHRYRALCALKEKLK